MRARLPDFLGIGPGRTGTTWLHDVLEGHTGLPARVKETEFFTTYYANGIEWYLSHFRHCADMEHVGEVCPYFGYTPARERIYAHIPKCRFLVTFRDPVDRAYSHYRMMRRYGWVNGTFEEALPENRQLVEESRYATHLRAWFDRFGRESFLIQSYDDLRSDPQRYLNEITEFIGTGRIDLARAGSSRRNINAAERTPANPRFARKASRLRRDLLARGAYRVVNLLGRAGVWEFCSGRGEKFPPITPEVDARVRERFRPEVDALEKLIGRDLSAWKETGGRTAASATPQALSY